MKTKSNPAPASNGTHYDEYLDQPLAKGWRKMGDFYEYSSTWGGGGSFKPSEIAKTLNLAVTRRGMDAMVGFPYHMAHKCVEALKAAGQWETSPAASSVPAPADTCENDQCNVCGNFGGSHDERYHRNDAPASPSWLPAPVGVSGQSLEA